MCICTYINIFVCLKMSLMKGQQFSGQKMTCFWGGDFVWFQRYQPDPRFRDQRISFFVNSVLPFDLTFWLKLNFQIYSSYWTWNIFHFFVWKNRFNVIFVPMAIWSIFCVFSQPKQDLEEMMLSPTVGRNNLTARSALDPMTWKYNVF